MTSTSKARACLTPAARQQRVWDKAAPSYDKQIALFGEHFTRRQLPLVQAAGFQVMEAERLKAGTVERIHAVKPA